jgi:hypothetical protein
MKAYLINILGIVVWVLFGRFSPAICLFLTPFYIPILFTVVGNLFMKVSNLYVYISFCFLLLLLNDLFYRFFGGGVHDKQGRFLCEIIFYATLALTFLSLLGFELNTSNKIRKTQGQDSLTFKQIGLKILFIIGISAITLLAFRLFNRSI